MIATLLLAGFQAVREYIALHVVTCLVPAFLLAGAIVAFVSKEAIVQRLGVAASRTASFSRPRSSTRCWGSAWARGRRWRSCSPGRG